MSTSSTSESVHEIDDVDDAVGDGDDGARRTMSGTRVAASALEYFAHSPRSQSCQP